MSDILEKRAMWQAADQWLTRWGNDGKFLEEAEKARDMMRGLDWGSDISALGVTCPKYNLTRLLSDQWLDDEIINMAVCDLASRVN